MVAIIRGSTRDPRKCVIFRIDTETPWTHARDNEMTMHGGFRVEANRFDHLIRSVTERGTRRGALGLLFGSAAGFAGLSAEAGKKKKKKHKKNKNRSGCRGGCPTDAVCRDKVCVFCASGQRACGNTCVVPNDRANCGACGKACPAGAVCQSGSCRFCDTGLTLCGNTCVNLATDPANCGRCGRTCPSGRCGNGACGCDDNTPCPGGCSCESSAQGGRYCAGAFTSTPCDNYQCPLGRVCTIGSNGHCLAACPG